MLKPGIYNLSDEEYSALEAERWSEVSKVADCPANYIHTINNRNRESTSSQGLGTLTHSMVLTPEELESHFYRAEKVDKRTKAGKAAWAEMLEKAGDRELIDGKVWDHAAALNDSVRRAMGKDLPEWSEGRKEIAVLGSMYDMAAKCKIDLVLNATSDRGPEVWDLKTTRDLSPRAFRNACHKYNYYGQIVSYTRLLKQFEPGAQVGGIIAVQTAAPYLTHVLRFSEEACKLGAWQCDKAWSELSWWKSKDPDTWPGYNYDGKLDPPKWWTP